ncbi:MAG: FeoB-associated Cys-rich membrane protein [Ruminococcaceae bacterium]|nr:FeoB-associated Cys-rich membrane protein [Oscillospiraceae bacterium]
MLQFIMNNIGSIIVGAAVLALVVFLSYRLISDKRQGKSSCGAACSSCPNAGLCHAAHDKKSVKKC